MNNYQTTAGIENKVWSSIDKSISNNDVSTFRELLSFLRKVLSKSIQNDSLTIFKQYIFFFSSFYVKSFSKYKENPSRQALYKECAEMAALHLKEIILYEIKIYYRQKTSSNRETDFYYWGFFGFSQLLFNLIANRDLVQFEDAMSEFSQINIRSRDFELRNKIDAISRAAETPENKLELQKLLAEQKVDDKFNAYGRHVIGGTKAWIYYIFQADKINIDELKAYTGLLSFSSSFKEMLEDILFMRNLGASQYFNWDSWDYEYRTNNKLYYPPNPHDWLTLGFIVDLLRIGSFYVEIENMSSDQLSDITSLYDSVKENIQGIKKNFEKWKTALNIDSIDDFSKREKIILDALAIVKRQNYSMQETAIADSKLDDELVATFKRTLWNAWEKRATIRHLFDRFNNKEKITNDEVKLMQTGRIIFLRKAKMMFIKGEYYRAITGTDPWGGDLGIAENNLFFHSILKENPKETNAKALLELVESCISTLIGSNRTASLIILNSNLIHRETDFFKDPNFIAKIELINSAYSEERYFLGEYRNIPVFGLTSNYLKNSIIVADFQEAFTMRYKEKENWYNDLLQLDLKEIDDETANSRLVSEPEYWMKTDEGIALSKEESITLIKTSMILETGTVLDFVVKDPDAYVIGKILME